MFSTPSTPPHHTVKIPERSPPSIVCWCAVKWSPSHRPAQLQSCLHRLKSQTLRRRLNGSTSARTSAQTLLRRQNTTPNPISAKTGTFVNTHPLAALFYNVTTPQTVAATIAVTPTHLTSCTPEQRGSKKKARRFLLLSDKKRVSAPN